MNRIDNVAIVLNYNDYETTKSMVLSICDYASLDKIIIVDNHSTNESLMELMKIVNNKIEVIETLKNGGYGYGNNYGIKYAIEHYKPKNVLISNPDVFFENETLQKMINFINDNKEYALVSAFCCDVNNIKEKNAAWKIGRASDYVLSLSPICRRIFHVLQYNDLLSSKEDIKDVEVLPGSFLLCRAETMYKYGMYDEKQFLFCEEMVLAIKMKNANYKSALLMNEKFIHAHSTSIKKAFSYLQSNRYLIKSKKHVLKEYYKANALIMFIANIIAFTSTIEIVIFNEYRRIKSRII